MKRVTVPQIAGRQRGVFTATQALDAGWTARQVRRRTTERRWIRVAGDGLAAAGTERTATAVAWAIHLTMPDAVISHVTAGLLHGFPRGSMVRERDSIPAHAVLTAGRDRSRSIRTWRWSLVDGDRLVVDRSVPVTARLRTAVDCLANLPRDRALSLLAWATTREVLTAGDITSAVERYRGRAGAEQLRYLAALTRRGALSVAEARCHGVLDEHGITGWAANVTISDQKGIIAVVDLAFLAERVIVEVDGWSAHSSHEAFTRDRRTQARLAAAGYVVLRVTWADLQGSGAAFAALLRRTLDGRR